MGRVPFIEADKDDPATKLLSKLWQSYGQDDQAYQGVPITCWFDNRMQVYHFLTKDQGNFLHYSLRHDSCKLLKRIQIPRQFDSMEWLYDVRRMGDTFYVVKKNPKWVNAMEEHRSICVLSFNLATEAFDSWETMIP